MCIRDSGRGDCRQPPPDAGARFHPNIYIFLTAWLLIAAPHLQAIVCDLPGRSERQLLGIGGTKGSRGWRRVQRLPDAGVSNIGRFASCSMKSSRHFKYMWTHLRCSIPLVQIDLSLNCLGVGGGKAIAEAIAAS
eukprot:5576470-Prymnesium_polylepis.1